MHPINEMHAALILYFGGEKRGSLLFLMAGGAAIAGALYLWVSGSPHRAMGWPLVAVALLQLAVGWTVFSRTDAKVKELHSLLAKAPADFLGAETPRMAAVRKGFRLYKTVEIVLLAIGLAGAFRFQERLDLHAASVGLAIQAGLMLVFDLYAESRAAQYVEQMRRLADSRS